MPKFDDRETAHILAALRHCQRSTVNINGMEQFDGVEGGPLSDDEVDSLCERINFDEDDPPEVAQAIENSPTYLELKPGTPDREVIPRSQRPTMQYTPGPWHVGSGGTTLPWCVYDQSGQLVASIAYLKGLESPTAALISKSPDLRERLADLVEYVTSMIDYYPQQWRDAKALLTWLRNNGA